MLTKEKIKRLLKAVENGVLEHEDKSDLDVQIPLSSAVELLQLADIGLSCKCKKKCKK